MLNYCKIFLSLSTRGKQSASFTEILQAITVKTAAQWTYYNRIELLCKRMWTSNTTWASGSVYMHVSVCVCVSVLSAAFKLPLAVVQGYSWQRQKGSLCDFVAWLCLNFQPHTQAHTITQQTYKICQSEQERERLEVWVRPRDRVCLSITAWAAGKGCCYIWG